MNYTIPDNRPFIAKSGIKTKARKTETRAKVGKLFNAYSLSVMYDHEHDRRVIKAEPKK